MRGMRIGAMMLAAGSVGGCTMDMAGSRVGGGASAGAASQPQATATLVDGAGAAKGTATFRQTVGGLQVMVSATGMTPGPKGLHFHMKGACDAPDFTTAAGHWNPTNRKHGTQSGAGPHLGDLPNIDIGADGMGRSEAIVAGVMLTGGATPLMDADGAAIIIHAGADDYRTDPSGNSGGRLACGVMTPA